MLENNDHTDRLIESSSLRSFVPALMVCLKSNVSVTDLFVDPPSATHSGYIRHPGYLTGFLTYVGRTIVGYFGNPSVTSTWRPLAWLVGIAEFAMWIVSGMFVRSRKCA